MASASELFSSVPAGAMLPYGGATTPAGWLLCYGQAVSRTTYAALFAAIGTAFGVGDGSTTFNLPDMEGRVPFGKDNMSGSAAGRLNNTGIDGTTTNPDGTTLGATGGSDRRSISRNGGITPEGTDPVVEDITFIDDIAVAQNGGYTGGDVYFSAMPPAIIFNYIIKT